MLERLKHFFGIKNKSKEIQLNPESKFLVSISGGEIINQRPEGKVERVAISDLKAVIIETNDTGPWGADVWWILVGSEKNGCVFPQGATGEGDILKVVQALPGFDNEAFINAMKSTDNQRFLCWKKDS